jgi:hypothetical protein
MTMEECNNAITSYAGTLKCGCAYLRHQTTWRLLRLTSSFGGTHRVLSLNAPLVLGMTAFHGRGFFGSAFQPRNPQAAVAAEEALIGLLIEITFIATFTNRFFAR